MTDAYLLCLFLQVAKFISRQFQCRFKCSDITYCARYLLIYISNEKGIRITLIEQSHCTQINLMSSFSN